MSIKHKRNGSEECPQSGFLVGVATLPAALMRHFLAHLAACIMVAAVTIAMIIYFQDLRLSVGFLICLYIAYLGLDIVWAYNSGKLILQRMICVKATKHPIMNCLEIICQEIDAEKPLEDRVHNFFVSNSKKNRNLFTTDTILDIFYRPDNPTQITTWSVLGYRTEH